MIRRIGLLSALAGAAGLLLAIPGAASGATKIGETFTPNQSYAGGWIGLEASSPGSEYTVPFPGVITSWSFEGLPSHLPQGLKLKLARNAGGVLYTIVGESPPENPTGSLNTYTGLHIPAEAGDVLGLYMGDFSAYTFRRVDPSAGFGEREHDGDVAPGSNGSFADGPFDIQLDVSATLERDCDHDGLGDETQDSNVIGPGCPVTGQRAAALKKCKKKAKQKHWTKKRLKKCKKKARLLPV